MCHLSVDKAEGHNMSKADYAGFSLCSIDEKISFSDVLELKIRRGSRGVRIGASSSPFCCFKTNYKT